MNYLDLFSGIGGFHKGLEEAGFKFEWSGHSEIDKYAKSIYQSHFKESEDLGDVSNINVQDLPEIDLVTFGFPCQDLSIAGKRGGLQASRSGLFYQATRIIEAKRPSYFIFENVKGLFSSNGGLDWLNVLREIADIGYDGQWQLLNTRWFLPQNRERVYFVGYPRGSGERKIFPIQEGNREVKTNDDGARVIDPSGHGGYRATRFCPTLLQRDYKEPKIIQLGRGFNKGGEKDICPTISTSSFEHNNHVDGIRRLTPTEAERLQGFPDGWTAKGKDGEIISDTQRYKTLGNAVSVPVVKAVGERLI